MMVCQRKRIRDCLEKKKVIQMEGELQKKNDVFLVEMKDDEQHKGKDGREGKRNESKKVLVKR